MSQDFHPILYPLSLERCISAPGWLTDITDLGNGWEQRLGRWDDQVLEFDAVHGVRSLADLRSLYKFHRLRKGRLFGFLVRDLLDYQFTDGSDTVVQSFETTVAGTVIYQVAKVYQDAENTDVRPIKKIEKGHFTLFLDHTLLIEGTDYDFTNAYEGASGGVCTVDGEITLADNPGDDAVLSCAGRFFVPVRFTEDKLPADEIYFNLNRTNATEWLPTSSAAGTIPNVLMREIRT
jgi:uncharacterized protein (TIGR02217 family)